MGKSERVFLVGPMGAGKSTIGRHLAELLHKDFLDSDHEIERRTGASISLIFEIEGEEGFRRRETVIIDELTRKENIVLATGGGAVLADVNRDILRERGVVVYLRAPLDVLVRRTHRDRNRPLLRSGNRRRTLEEITQERDPIYRESAHMVIDTEYRAPQKVAREILERLQALQVREDI